MLYFRRMDSIRVNEQKKCAKNISASNNASKQKNRSELVSCGCKDLKLTDVTYFGFWL